MAEPRHPSKKNGKSVRKVYAPPIENANIFPLENEDRILPPNDNHGNSRAQPARLRRWLYSWLRSFAGRSNHGTGSKMFKHSSEVFQRPAGLNVKISQEQPAGDLKAASCNGHRSVADDAAHAAQGLQEVRRENLATTKVKARCDEQGRIYKPSNFSRSLPN